MPVSWHALLFRLQRPQVQVRGVLDVGELQAATALRRFEVQCCSEPLRNAVLKQDPGQPASNLQQRGFGGGL